MTARHTEIHRRAHTKKKGPANASLPVDSRLAPFCETHQSLLIHPFSPPRPLLFLSVWRRVSSAANDRKYIFEPEAGDRISGGRLGIWRKRTHTNQSVLPGGI